MIWDIISKKLSDAGLGVEGETMFEKRFPADADIGIGFFEPLGGIVVDPHRPGFFKPELQIIVRHKNITEGTELAKAVMKTLTVKGEKFYPANAERGAVMLKVFYPQTLPIQFPALDGNCTEWSVNFTTAFSLHDEVE